MSDAPSGPSISAFESATTLIERLRARRIGARELLEYFIRRIERYDGLINAVIVRDFERARARADAADRAIGRGEVLGPLHGLPMTIKESFHFAGTPTTFGFPEFRGNTAASNAVVVDRLLAAGAVIFGKTNVPPGLMDGQSWNEVYGRTNNPWDLARGPGGSSGGAAAALAARMIPLEFGSDIGGSIRNPAHFCGLYGHKPSYDLIPLRGHSPPGVPDGAGIVLAVVGPLARTADDLGLALDVLAGPDEGEATGYRLALPPPRHARLADYRILVVDQHPLAVVDDEIRAGLNGLADGLQKLGATVARSSDRLPDLANLHEAYMNLLNPAMSRGQPGVQTISAHEWMAGLDAQAAIRRQFAHLFEAFDVVLMPVLGAPAFPHDDEPDGAKRTLTINGEPTRYFAQIAWSGPATFACLPSTAIPVGRTRAGLPFGAQVIGPYLEDRTTIGFAGLVEREFGGFQAPPGY
jgi:amidase